MGSKKQIEDELLTTIVSKDELQRLQDTQRVAETYMNLTTCRGGRVQGRGFRCPHCDSIDPTGFCAEPLEGFNGGLIDPCVECGNAPKELEDPRSPPMEEGPCMCQGCVESVLEDMIDEEEQGVTALRERLEKIRAEGGA